jgi:hypothetical protein
MNQFIDQALNVIFKENPTTEDDVSLIQGLYIDFSVVCIFGGAARREIAEWGLGLVVQGHVHRLVLH